MTSIEAEYTRWAMPKHFTMRHFPSKERFRARQISSFVIILSIFISTFFLLFSFTLYEINVPSALTGSLVHFKPKGLESLNLQEPNHIALVFSTLSFRPEISSNCSTSLIEFSTEFKFPIKSVVVLCSVENNLIPCIVQSCLTLAAKISTPEIKI